MFWLIVIKRVWYGGNGHKDGWKGELGVEIVGALEIQDHSNSYDHLASVTG